MPTVNERINEMARIMCGCYRDGKCSAHHNAGCASIGGVDCLSKQKALALFRAGYLHISDNQDMIKQIKIDVLNQVKEKCSYTFTGKRIIAEPDIDKIIKEIEDESNKY